MKKIVIVLLLLIVSANAALKDVSRAEEILKQAREALGGEQRLQKIESLHINGKYRRVFDERQMGGDREISISLPNKYLVEDAMSAGGLSTAMINTRGLNGEKAWSASSGGGGGMIFRMQGPGGEQATPEQMEARLRRVFQAELCRYLLALTLAPAPSLPVEYKYAGESDVDGEPAEVVDVVGPDQFMVRLFFDKKSHLPLLLSYRGPKPRVITMTRQGNAPARTEPEAPAAPQEVDFYIRLSEHKKVDGVMLPFKFTFLTESEVSEEFEVSKYQLNPQFKTDKFEKR